MWIFGILKPVTGPRPQPVPNTDQKHPKRAKNMFWAQLWLEEEWQGKTTPFFIWSAVSNAQRGGG